MNPKFNRDFHVKISSIFNLNPCNQVKYCEQYAIMSFSQGSIEVKFGNCANFLLPWKHDLLEESGKNEFCFNQI